MISDQAEAADESGKIDFVRPELEDPEDLKAQKRERRYFFDLDVVDQTRHDLILLTHSQEGDKRHVALFVILNVFGVVQRVDLRLGGWEFTCLMRLSYWRKSRRTSLLFLLPPFLRI